MDPGGFKIYNKQVEFPVAGSAEFGQVKTVRIPVDAHHLLSRVVCAFDLPELVPNRVMDGASAVFVNASRQVAREPNGLYYDVSWPAASLFTPLDASERTRFDVDGEHVGTFQPNTAGQLLGGTFDAGALPAGAWEVERLAAANDTVMARSLDVAAAPFLPSPVPATLTLASDAPATLHTYSESVSGLGTEIRTAEHAETFAVTVAPKTEAHPLFNQGSGQAFVLGTAVLVRGRTYTMDNSVNHADHPLIFSAAPNGQALGDTTEAGVLTLTVPEDAASLHFRCGNHPKMGGELPVLASTVLDFAGAYACPEPVLPRGVELTLANAPADLAFAEAPEGSVPVVGFPNPVVVVAPAETPEGAPGYAFTEDPETRVITLAIRPPNTPVLEAAGLPVVRYQFTNPQGEQIRYIDRVSSLLLDQVKLLVDKRVVQEQSGVFSVLYGDLSKREAGVEQVFLDRQDRTLTTYADRIPATTVYTPLKLFFCEALAAALPIYKLRGSVVELEFKFRPFQDTYMTRLNLFNGMVRDARDRPGTRVPDVVGFGATLFVDYVDASEANLALFDSAESYLITSYHRVTQEQVTEPDVQVEVQGITAPVQRLVWFVQSEANLAANDALNFTTRSAYDEASAPVFYRSSASHDPQQQVLTPADFVVLDPAVATGANVPQALAHISAAVQNNTAVLYNVYYDFMQTQVVVDQAITQLYEIENNILNYVDEHVAYLWRKTAELDGRLEDVERNVDHFPHEYDADAEHMLRAASLRDAAGDIVTERNWRHFHYLDGYLRNNYLRYNVYSLWFSQRKLAQVQDVSDIVQDSWPGARGGGTALHDQGITLRLRLNPEHVSPEKPVRIFVYAVTYGVLRIDREGKAALCQFEKAGQVWNCAGGGDEGGSGKPAGAGNSSSSAADPRVAEALSAAHAATQAAAAAERRAATAEQTAALAVRRASEQQSHRAAVPPSSSSSSPTAPQRPPQRQNKNSMHSTDERNNSAAATRVLPGPPEPPRLQSKKEADGGGLDAATDEEQKELHENYLEPVSVQEPSAAVGSAGLSRLSLAPDAAAARVWFDKPTTAPRPLTPPAELAQRSSWPPQSQQSGAAGNKASLSVVDPGSRPPRANHHHMAAPLLGLRGPRPLAAERSAADLGREQRNRRPADPKEALWTLQRPERPEPKAVSEPPPDTPFSLLLKQDPATRPTAFKTVPRTDDARKAADTLLRLSDVRQQLEAANSRR